VGGRWFSLRAALHGAWHTLRTQPNAWIEVAALIVVAAAALWFRIAPIEWALLALTVFLVLALEAVNTAIEAVVDLVSPGYHPLARVAKDAAAGALVFAVIASVVVAAAIFGPRLVALFSAAPPVWNP
jgi:diacylglycerol kinase